MITSMWNTRSGHIVVALLLGLAFPCVVLAQNSAIAGTVRDTSGAVLPGVTVEAESPALIEKALAVVTDGAGVYRIVDLRPGIYSVTFTLTGFNTLKREGIELTTSFIATVNADLRVGSVEETLTVSGASPVVDTRNVVQQRVMTRDVMDALPTSRNPQNLVMLVPGVVMQAAGGGGGSADVGGSAGDRNMQFRIHGSRGDGEFLFDGMPMNNFFVPGRSTNVSTIFNNGAVQEISYQTSAIPAELALGGVATNMIPKDGGNTYRGSFFGAYGTGALQAANLDDRLRALGLSNTTKLDKVWDINPSVGGPFVRDRLWFYASGRVWGSGNFLTTGHYNKIDYRENPNSFAYEPDLSRPALDNHLNKSTNLRLTWQAAPKARIGFFGQFWKACRCHEGLLAGAGAIVTPEASLNETSKLAYFWQATASAPISNRLLFEAGFTQTYLNKPNRPAEDTYARDEISVDEQSTNVNYRYKSAAGEGVVSPMFGWNAMMYRASLSYVTGSHAFKVGFNNIHSLAFWDEAGPALGYTFLNGVPIQLTMNAKPNEFREGIDSEGGMYAQDQWTIRRLTLNAGIRYDWVIASVKPQHHSAGQFVAARDTVRVSDVPNWRDLTPRVGVAYDVFGNGKTGVKAHINKYLDGTTSGIALARTMNLSRRQVTRITRNWTDADKDFVPDCDLMNPVTNDECGPFSNSRFGTNLPTINLDPDLVTGFGKRIYNWEGSVSIQHELRANVSVNAGYYRRWYGNLGYSTLNLVPVPGALASISKNRAISPADHDPYCVTAPANPNLPGGGGYQVCGLYNINQSKFGQVDEVVSFAKNYGDISDVYDGVDFTVNMRLPNGRLLQGGTSTGRERYERCFVLNSPQELLHCSFNPPFETHVALAASSPLPWDFGASLTFQNRPGIMILANYSAPNAAVVPTLGRSLSGNASTVTVPLIEPGTMYTARFSQADFRLTRAFTLRRFRMQGNLDIYNLFNSNSVMSHNVTYGSAWLQPTAVLPGRLMKFSASRDF